jgi:glycosyltransferase involved in cell wall biosynthesis
MADFELIVVVDGRDPETEEALSGFDDPRLRVVVHPESVGPGEARNTGIEASLSRWIAFLDDDDQWAPQKLERQLAVVPAEPAIVTCTSKVITPHGTYLWPGEIYNNAMPFDEYLFDRRTWFKGGQSFWQTSSLLIPREVFRTLRFTRDRQHEDWELVIRAVKVLGYRLLTAPEPLVMYFVRHDRPSLSNRSDWRVSLRWIDGLGELVTPRAYSGFCLTMIAPIAARQRAWSAMPMLLGRAFRRGRPNARQLVAFFAFFALRTRLRALIQARGQDSIKSALIA